MTISMTKAILMKILIKIVAGNFNGYENSNSTAHSLLKKLATDLTDKTDFTQISIPFLTH
jgi:hypothetical protein